MEPLSSKALLALLQSEGVDAFLPEHAAPFSADSVCIDSRKVQQDALFVPLAGERVDGHDFIEKALEAGAAGFLAKAGHKVPCPERALFVPSPKDALFALSCAWRKTLSLSMVSVTGSVGKTTTKDLIAGVLSQKHSVCQTEGNFNNELGLPLTLLRLEHTHTAAVTELGMSALGEIARLSAAARPDIGVITNVGTAHIEHLHSRENIALAKLEIAAGMKDGAPLIVNGFEPLLQDRAETARLRVLPVGRKGSFLWAEDVSEEVFPSAGSRFTVCGAADFSVFLPLPGRHNVQNALLAVAVGLLSGVSPEQIASALQSAAPSGMRQRLYQAGGITILEDCYNASPDSMQAALAVLKGLPGRRFAVLGDMLELGGHSAAAHEAVGAITAASADVFLACGTEMQRAISPARAVLGENAQLLFKDEAALYLAKHIRPGDSVLFKGSRGMRMEEVLAAFCQKTGLTKEMQEAR